MRLGFDNSDYNFELEGDLNEVLDSLPRVQKALQEFYSQMSKNESVLKTTKNPLNAQPNRDLPTLNTLVIKQKAKTELEWIVLYAYYKSEQASKTFTKENIHDAYNETKRKTGNRMKNFSANMRSAIKNSLFSDVNDREIVLTAKGISLAENIINR